VINQEIAKIFYLMSEYLQMDDEESFRSTAYLRAARTLESMTEDVEMLYQQSGLRSIEKIPGIGHGIALKIEEYIKSKKVVEFDKLHKEFPFDLDTLGSVRGLGPKMIKVLYHKLKIKTLDDLERAARTGKIRSLPRFGEKVQYNILRSIEFIKRSRGRFLLGHILPVIKELVELLKGLPEVLQVEMAGSARRRLPTIGDLDILVATNKPVKVIKFFTSFPRVEKIWGRGATKASVRWRDGFNVDLREIKLSSFGAALQYFTGSKDHNIALRRLAQAKGFKLNEYGLWRLDGKKEIKIVSRTEKVIYETLGLSYLEPEIRENTGEIEAAIQEARGVKNSLPCLIGYDEVLGDLQMHSDWSDGSVSIEEMAKVAKKLGRKYIVITDHTGDLKIANGLDAKRLLSQMKEIDTINQRISGIKILKGAEVNIQKDGALDMPDEVLAKLDVVLAAVHTQMDQDKQTMTERLIRAISHPLVNIIAHPTGRILQEREGYQLDFDQVLKVAKKNNTFLEIDAYCDRLDLSDRHIRRCVQAGVKLSIDTDSHHPSQLWMMELGISQARRGWAEADDIINVRSWDELKKLLKKN